MTEYKYYRVQVEQSIPATKILTRVIEVEVKVPQGSTEDGLIHLASNIAQKEAEKLNFNETIDSETGDIVENKPEYYVYEATTRPSITAVDSIEVI